MRRNTMKRIRLRRPSAGMIVGVVAVVLAIAGTAVAASNLKLANFEPSSRDRLAGTGVIQYAAQAHNTGDVGAPRELRTFTVRCELEKKATAGGFKWTGPNPPGPGAYEILDSYPNGSGFVVRIYVEDASAAENQPVSVFSNCVKSRKQNGTPPA
jgi:hypothetical protein